MNRVILYAVAVCCAWFLVSSCASVSKRYGEQTNKTISGKDINYFEGSVVLNETPPGIFALKSDGLMISNKKDKNKSHFGIPRGTSSEDIKASPDNFLGRGYEFIKDSDGGRLKDKGKIIHAVAKDTSFNEIGFFHEDLSSRFNVVASGHYLVVSGKGELETKLSELKVSYYNITRYQSIRLPERAFQSLTSADVILTGIYYGHKIDYTIKNDQTELSAELAMKFIKGGVDVKSRFEKNKIKCDVRMLGYKEKVGSYLPSFKSEEEIKKGIENSFTKADPVPIAVAYTKLKNFSDSTVGHPVLAENTELEILNVNVETTKEDQATGQLFDNEGTRGGVPDLMVEIFSENKKQNTKVKTLDTQNDTIDATWQAEENKPIYSFKLDTSVGGENIVFKIYDDDKIAETFADKTPIGEISIPYKVIIGQRLIDDFTYVYDPPSKDLPPNIRRLKITFAPKNFFSLGK